MKIDIHFKMNLASPFSKVEPTICKPKGTQGTSLEGPPTNGLDSS